MNNLRKGAKVKCINNSGYENKLVIGRIYTLAYDKSDAYVDLFGVNGGYAGYRFVVVCPCGLDKCIAKHKDQ